MQIRAARTRGPSHPAHTTRAPRAQVHGPHWGVMNVLAAGPVGMRSRALMTVALRVMGNLVTDSDRDTVARAWRTAGKLSLKLDHRTPFS